MKYKEFKKAVEDWGRIYGYNSVVEGVFSNKYIAIKDEYDVQTICEIPNTQRFVIDLNWYSYKILSENAKGHLFEIVTEFAKTKPEDRECEDRESEKRFIIPLPELVTISGRQQYLTNKGGCFYASRRDGALKQIWKEEDLKFVPEIYRQFAVEFDEGKEY